MFKLPIQVPDPKQLFITQKFGVTANTLEPVGPNGEEHFHYGVDIVIAPDDHATYGAHLICPFPEAQETERVPEPAGDLEHSPYVALKYHDGTDEYRLTLVHCSEMEPMGTFKEGELVAKVGNIGIVWPHPSLKDPYAGAHLHLGLQVNGQWADPLKYFDFSQPFIGPAPTWEDALPASKWEVQKLLDILKPFISPTN